ncbi:TauD/TfdA family dioxygenase [Actinomadura roseirufa]|uniref:TauD/TfdA family dioxygenase n=1 Tax=Actinomadura roseirufa TaxID=2094049 RepID=UPI0013F16D79|nr:TauD/TfdA family dioxygenase [Actinomadura roseirufa]
MRRAAPLGYELSPAEAERAGAVMARLRHAAEGADETAIIRAAHVRGGLLPEGLLGALADFRRFGNEHGVLAVRNIPITRDLPPTPSRPESAARGCTPSVAALLLLMSRLGDPIAYAEEKRGALVQDICPIPGEEERQENTGAVYFKLHTENAFHTRRPDFVGLLCLRGDHERRAASITASISQAYPVLSAADVAVLREPRFQTRLAPSFCRGRARRPYTKPAPIITGTAEFPRMCVDFDDTRPCDEPAARALASLGRALQRVRRESVLRPGELAIIDNSAAVHGRAAFTPRYDGSDRWLQRMFVVETVRPLLGEVEQGSVYRCGPLPFPEVTVP